MKPPLPQTTSFFTCLTTHLVFFVPCCASRNEEMALGGLLRAGPGSKFLRDERGQLLHDGNFESGEFPEGAHTGKTCRFTFSGRTNRSGIYLPYALAKDAKDFRRNDCQSDGSRNDCLELRVRCAPAGLVGSRGVRAPLVRAQSTRKNLYMPHLTLAQGTSFGSRIKTST